MSRVDAIRQRFNNRELSWNLTRFVAKLPHALIIVISIVESELRRGDLSVLLILNIYNTFIFHYRVKTSDS